MDKSKRRVVIAGNWKMNKTPSEAVKLIDELKGMVGAYTDCDIVVCVPDLDIAAVAQAIKGTNIHLGAQNIHWEKSGAFTGETSADMLCEAGVEYVVIGHSERRRYFGELDGTVNLRMKAAINAGITAIVCVGEIEIEREQGITEEIVGLQVKKAFYGIEESQLNKIIIAYEPVWAIGTGKTATNEQADEVNGYIRKVIAGLYSQAAADAMTIQYGGSMNAANAADLLAKVNVDGGLIGGASLKAADFTAIIKAGQA